MTDVKFTVEGMTCGHCKSAVEQAVGKIPGVASVTVSLERKEAEVSYDEAKTAPEAFKDAIEDIGFDVKGI